MAERDDTVSDVYAYQSLQDARHSRYQLGDDDEHLSVNISYAGVVLGTCTVSRRSCGIGPWSYFSVYVLESLSKSLILLDLSDDLWLAVMSQI